MKLTTLAQLLPLLPTALAAYNLAHAYAGESFFDGWNFYDSYDNLTNGDVWFVSRANATSKRLAYVNDDGHAIMRVDNQTFVPWNEKRDTVRIQSHNAYPIGSVWVIDIHHMPTGCSVWPAFWTIGNDWPEDGEIDIVEQVNLATNNQYALHTDKGCLKAAAPSAQTGQDGDNDCGTAKGCVTVDRSDRSFGAGFNAAGGGVWATQFDTSGIFIWFWSRADIPASVTANASEVDPSTWGTPSAAFLPTNCDISRYFGPQHLVLGVTLCGDWAGAGGVYNASSCYSTANGKQGLCYVDNVINEGSPQYDEAWFDIGYVRAYTLPGLSISSAAPSGTASGSGSSAPSATATGGSSSAAPRQLATGAVVSAVVGAVAAAVLAVV